MAKYRQITIGGRSFSAPRGQLLLDAALSNGVDLPYDCRAGHCGTCCVRVISGQVQGGQGSEPGIVHACQCRIASDVVIERPSVSGILTVDGVLSSLRSLSRDVVEVGIKTDRALPYHAGQYAQVQFDGFPSRPFSLTLPLSTTNAAPTISLHVRRMQGGSVTPALGKRIKAGHRVAITGPYGSAHFKPNVENSLILVATSTGFAPIWSIAVAALRENPERKMMIIAGGRNLETLYMAPALAQLSSFKNVFVVPVCSTPQTFSPAVRFGRPTDYLPRLLPRDIIYACGAPAMVEAVKAIAARAGATCYADPFLPTPGDGAAAADVLTRAKGWLSLLKRCPASQPPPGRVGNRRKKPARGYGTTDARVDNHSRFQSL